MKTFFLDTFQLERKLQSTVKNDFSYAASFVDARIFAWMRTKLDFMLNLYSLYTIKSFTLVYN